MHWKYTDQSEEEESITHVRQTQTRAGTYRDHQKSQTTVSYYTWTRSRTVGRNVKKKYARFESESSFEDDANYRAYVTSHVDTSHLTNIFPFYSHPLGSPHIDLMSLKHSNKKFNMLMLYRSYRLLITTEHQSSGDIAEVRFHNHNLNLTLNNQTIKIIDFLTRFVNKTNMFNMSEGQEFIGLPTFLADVAQNQVLY